MSLPIVLCSGIIPLRKDDEGYKAYIILHRNGLYWGFPKGHIHEGEDEKAAAIRELKEETRLTIQSFLNFPPFFQSYTITKDHQKLQKNVTYYAALTSSHAHVQLTEILTGRWVKVEDLSSFVSFDQNKEMCKILEQCLLTIE